MPCREQENGEEGGCGGRWWFSECGVVVHKSAEPQPRRACRCTQCTEYVEDSPMHPATPPGATKLLKPTPQGRRTLIDNQMKFGRH